MSTTTKIDTGLEKLRDALARLDKEVQSESDEIYVKQVTRRSHPSMIPAMPYDLHTDTQAALLGYRSRDAEVADLALALNTKTALLEEAFLHVDWDKLDTELGFPSSNGKEESLSSIAELRSQIAALQAEKAELQKQLDEAKRLGLNQEHELSIGTHASHLGRIGGSKTSERKAQAVRKNGAKGGRPKSTNPL